MEVFIMNDAEYKYNNVTDFTENELELLGEIACTRRPAIFFRGKTLTHDELITLVVNEEPCLRHWGPNGEDLGDKDMERDYYGTLGCCLQRQGFGWETSMVLADGSVYGSLLLPKYPEWYEYIPRYEELAKRNPFLEMVIALTAIDENHCSVCGLVSKFALEHDWKDTPLEEIPCLWEEGGMCYARLDKWFQNKSLELSETWGDKKHRFDVTPYQREVLRLTTDALTPINIAKSIKMVLHIKNGELTVVTGDEAGKLYMEYDRTYADPRMYIGQEAYFYGHELLLKKRVHFNNAFMRECCAKLGYTQLWDEVIVPRYMNPFRDEEVDVVTKEFLITEWDKAFGNTTMCYENLLKYQEKYAGY